MNARLGVLRCLVFFVVSQTSGCRDADHVQGGLKQEAYLWSRLWQERGFAPLSEVPATVQGLVVLTAEVQWRLSKFEVTEIPADFGQLKRFGRPVGLAIRMGRYPGPFRSDDQAGRLLVDLATRLARAAEKNQVPLHELQIDFDCAESKLEGYCVWMVAIRQAVKPVPVTFTALPSWLDRSAFGPLARASDGFVLQVHSVEPPDQMDGPVALCDPVQARHWVEMAGQCGVPFRVALPTYRCWLVFRREGRLVKVDTNPYRPWVREGELIRRVEADPFAMADLVREWSRQHPSAMQGILWYRLPSRYEDRGWPWPTFLSVLAGRHPERPPLQVQVKAREKGVYELSLINPGEIRQSFPAEIVLKWKSGTWASYDSFWSYRITRTEPTTARLCRAEKEGDETVEPAGTRNLGWIRLENAEDLRGEIHENQ